MPNTLTNVNNQTTVKDLKSTTKSSSVPRIVLTAGEPAGVGSDLILQIAQQPWPAELIIITNADCLQQRAQQLQLPLQLIPFIKENIPQRHQPGSLKIINVKTTNPVQAGRLDPANSSYVIKTLQLAADGALKRDWSAVVTGPIHKGVINAAGIPFTGHTEFFAAAAGVELTVMMLMSNVIKVALVTTHLPLAAVAKAITAERLTQTIEILQQDLSRYFNLPQPKILVAGLNPHAGEMGHLGREELEIIIPVLEKLRQRGLHLIGPLPADTLFIPKNLAQGDVVLTMYHDQGLPVLKFQDFDHSINVTLGLPFIRTSVDHGTALELAGTGKAQTTSLEAAVKTAILMCNAL